MQKIGYLLCFLTFSVTLYAAPGRARADRGYYFDSGTKKYFTNGKSSFSIKPTGNSKYLDRIEVSVDSHDFTTYKGKLAFDQEGLHTIRFRAVDPVLNWSPIQVFRIYVDLTPPTSKISWKGHIYQRDQQLFISPKAQLVISSEDNLSGPAKINMQIGTQPLRIYSTPMSFTHDGPVKMRVSSVDHVGNTESWKDLSFTVDSQPPTTHAALKGVYYHASSTYYFNYGTKIVLNSKDDGVGLGHIEYKVNDGPTLTYSAPITLDQKKVTLKYRSQDLLGNQEEWKSLSMVQDSHPPILSFAEIGKYIHVAGKTYTKPGYTLNIKASDPDSGIKEISYSTDGHNYQPLKGHQIVVPSSGEFTYNIRAIDQVGNIDEANPITVVVDDTSPSTTAQFSEKTVTKNDRVLTALPNRLSFTSSDSGSGINRVEISFDGKHFSTLKNDLDLATWKDSVRNIYYRGIDRLGNVELAKKLTVQVLTRGPAVNLFVESGNLPSVPLSSIIHSESENHFATKSHTRKRRKPASVHKRTGD